MNILAIDTSTDWSSVSLFVDGECNNSIHEHVPRKHSEILPKFVQRIFKESNFKKDDLDAIAVSIGPGSFTGLRIGLGFSKGLAYALNKPIIPVPTLEVIANDPSVRFDDFLVILFSHRNIVYSQKFLNKKSATDPKVSIFDEVDLNLNIIHYGCDKLLKSKTSSKVKPSAESVGRLALLNFKEWKVDKPYTLISNYISPFEVG